MKQLFFILLILLVLVGCGEKSGIITTQTADRVYIQTIYEGKCLMDETALWSAPGSIAEGAEQMHTITGTCQGTPVTLLQSIKDKRTGRNWYEVKQGWITSSFVVKELQKVNN